MECLGTVLNSCYAYSHTHRDMRGCHLCVHTLPWPRKHGHINGTLPERLLLMFAYTWSPARLPPMCAYFALAPHMCPYFSFAPKVWTHSWHIAKTVATHVSIHVDTCAVANPMCPYFALAPNVWTHRWQPRMCPCVWKHGSNYSW